MITIIAAVAANRVIGKNNDLPWYLPDDLAHFKELTKGHPVIMGRKTYESILSRIKKPLPGRMHFILTRHSAEYKIPEEFKDQVILCATLNAAVQQAQKIDDQVFVVGGEYVFAEALPIADKLELTELDQDYEGDAMFPEFDPDDWLKIERPQNGYTFATYTKKALK